LGGNEDWRGGTGTKEKEGFSKSAAFYFFKKAAGRTSLSAEKVRKSPLRKKKDILIEKGGTKKGAGRKSAGGAD